MKKLHPFQLLDVVLQPGVTLIEASAGTGKTFAIAGLFLRFVLEMNVDIREILVVTYTVTATEELRDRIRKRLKKALRDLKEGSSTDEIINRFLKDGSRESGIRNLDLAVQNFDEARIFTIHGFCQRVLGENAFESGSVFEMEMLADSASFLEEIVRDFWRRSFYTASPLISRLAVAHGKSHSKWTELLESLRNHPDIRIVPDAPAGSSAGLSAMITTKYEAIISGWKTHGRDVVELLKTDASLSREQKAFSPGRIEMITTLLDRMVLSPAAPPVEGLALLAMMSNSGIARKIKPSKAASPPKHLFFDLCEDFTSAATRFFDRLTHDFIAFARTEMPLRKEQLNVVTYEDLLTRVRDAVKRGGNGFAQILGAAYRVALIDEFQDTDPVQYEIFESIFGKGAHHLYFIGDPKQAIYGFRGADVHTYLQASHEASRHFTLDTNWRSEKPLLHAFNLLFSKNPVLGEGIVYQEVSFPEQRRPEFAEIQDKDSEARLRFRYLEGENGKEISQTTAESRIFDTVASDIRRLISRGVKIGARELQLRDMAVLVRSNAQAARLQELLRSQGVKSVLKTDKSVFQGLEAEEMLLLMEGVLQPARGHYLTTALSTTLIGLSPAELVELQSSSSHRRLDEFLEYRELWEKKCFMAMFRKMFVAEKVRERLVKRPGGERLLANFLHLGELLHEAETERRLTPEGLRLWLCGQMRSIETAADEHQLRLESDEDAVLIATIHKSKGLEYPVVFCPFLWKPMDGVREKEILFHDPSAGNHLTFDLGGTEETVKHDTIAQRERQGEALRLLYVALTRAKNLCYVYAGDILKSGESPLAMVIGEQVMKSRMEDLALRSAGTIDMTLIDADENPPAGFKLPPANSVMVCKARDFSGIVSQSQMIGSFSSLISDRDKEDQDASEPALDEITEQPDEIFSMMSHFERGVRAGNFWHEVLEQLDFQKPADIDPLVKEKLISFGIAETYQDAVGRQIRNLLNVPLSHGITLSSVSARERLSEVKFSHPVRSLVTGRLQNVFEKHTAGINMPVTGALGKLNFRPIEGFMKGAIDLIFRSGNRFYIVDWKSNWLGPNPSCYDERRLAPVILESYYFLQYHLYTVAVDLFLRRKLKDYDYEKHFGGVFYLFLRGVDPGSLGRGVFQDRPDAALVADLRDLLMGRAS